MVTDLIIELRERKDILGWRRLDVSKVDICYSIAISLEGSHFAKIFV